MKFVVDLPRGILGKPDDPKLWMSILSTRKLFRSCKYAKRILVVGGGHGTEVDILVKLHGIEIVKNIFFVDLFVCFTNDIKARYPSINTMQGNFLKMEIKRNMKFDVIVGNPPFKGTESSLNLWPLFIEKAVYLLNDKGMLAMITPTTWMRPSTDIKRTKKEGGSKYILKDFFQQLNTIEMNVGSFDEYFSVNSTFCWFILSKEKYQGTTLITAANNEQVIVDLRNFKVFPSNATSVVISIFEKLQQPKNKFSFKGIRGKGKEDLPCHITQTTRFKYQYVSKFYNEKELNKKHQCIMLYSTKKHPDFDKPKIIVNYIGDIHPYVDSGNAGMQYTQVHYLDSKKECTGAKSLFASKLFRLFFNHVRYGMHNEAGVLNALPKLDMIKKWTDEELYKHFNLTQEEIDYVEANAK